MWGNDIEKGTMFTHVLRYNVIFCLLALSQPSHLLCSFSDPVTNPVCEKGPGDNASLCVSTKTGRDGAESLVSFSFFIKAILKF